MAEAVFMKKNPLYKSFGYAFQGIGNTIRSERNIKIHLTVMTLVIVFGIFFICRSRNGLFV